MKFSVLPKSSFFRLLLSGLLLGISPLTQAAFVTNLSDTKIQNVLANYFPLREYATFARVSLKAPKVQLQTKNKNVVLIIPVIANVVGSPALHGQITMRVNLAYKPVTGGLYFSAPNIQQFDIPGATEEVLAELQKIIEDMGKNSLTLVRIYTVNERDLNHSLSKSTLKSSIIEDGRLRLVFGFN